MENMIGFLICILIGLVMLISGVIVLLVFKKKRRQNYRRKNGHRQSITLVKITDVCGK